ncbi:MAG TPA: nitrite reductase large subunit NirB [Steroidobacteraceae bacterium]|nr:nitrite reductase large subunit NirB [Steroidobacteraceae bacterium]
MKIVVIGNGMVGQRLVELLAAKLPAPLEVSILCEEPRAAYDRVHLTSFFSGKSAEDLSLAEPGFFERSGIRISLADRAVSIDRARHQVHSATGQIFAYDRLVLATGSRAFVPGVPGNDRPGCFVYRTIEDLEAIRAASAHARSGVVIGGGLLGLEAAKALKDLGLETEVVEFAPRLMAVQLDDLGGRILRSRIAELGVGVHTGRNTVEITTGAARAQCLRFADGGTLETDLIVFSAGIRPRDELARTAGLSVGERGGIVVDEYCRTSDPEIFAIGECALWRGRTFGLVAPGYQMAAVAASTLCGDSSAAFTGADMSTKLKLLGVDVASLGDAHAATPGARTCSLIDERRQIYKKLVVSEDGRQLLGAILVGEAEEYGSLLQVMQNSLQLPERPEQLIFPMVDAAANGDARGSPALPDSAQICSCNSVSKGDLCAAVAAGATTLGALKKCTRAATACGGCGPLVTQILKVELARQGVAVSDHLCEHFPYSRQQLFHLVRVGGLRTFTELLGKHGRGRGCDICKPVAASIFASCWNEFVLTREQASLQDSNDYYLANIQKDGSYSVIPRIAGGEITPQQLIRIGEIAAKYRLYTKITGGQRIDMLGAQVHQLPLIWSELVAAGFESGHAYGKALRTVKSCVGSTWCRYGVQDSVGLALELENRYKGLRSPHKLKFGVSGCTRECAEAQGKDVGVIATEKGWNLYVCGNGGMKPRHAELLAADLDRATLIRYVDRFLMFYIRTADRLQRTSVWRDNLQGGLDYLKEVVCEDRLGIARELEADMQGVIDAYACEWRKAIEDPQTLRRFRHFVNSDRSDDHIEFVDERGQPRPALPRERRRPVPV